MIILFLFIKRMFIAQNRV